MASSLRFSLALFLSSSLLVHAVLGAFECEDLRKDVCAFSVASSGKRCLLETWRKKDGREEYQCRTSEIVVGRLAGYIETDECIEACGLDRKAVGISSDALLEPQFMDRLCSPPCYNKCQNIVDLYLNLAAGEGVNLDRLCEAQRSNPHRAMFELLSSGAATAVLPDSPAPAPAAM